MSCACSFGIQILIMHNCTVDIQFLERSWLILNNSAWPLQEHRSILVPSIAHRYLTQRKICRCSRSTLLRRISWPSLGPTENYFALDQVSESAAGLNGLLLCRMPTVAVDVVTEWWIRTIASRGGVGRLLMMEILRQYIAKPFVALFVYSASEEYKLWFV